MIALATAGATFAIGMIVLPIEKPAPEPTPPAALSPPPAPVVPPPPPAPAASVDAAALADAATSALADAKSAPVATDATAEPAKADAAAAPEAKPEAAAASAKAEAPASREKTADKDVAREAWRKNQPDISVDGGKATMIIPIKGSIDGATYHVTTKPRSVLVTLPKGESMITMPYYPLKRDGFRQLWIKKDEQSGATVLRIVLGDVSDPQADIKDDYVRVTVRRPADAPDEGSKPEGSKPGKAEKSDSAKPAPESP